MTSVQTFEDAAFACVTDELSLAGASLGRAKLSLGSLEIVRSDEGDDYLSELRVYVYRDGQICDALEVILVRGSRAVVTLDELKEWFREQLQELSHSQS